jgi:hypothetical protein
VIPLSVPIVLVRWRHSVHDDTNPQIVAITAVPVPYDSVFRRIVGGVLKSAKVKA